MKQKQPQQDKLRGWSLDQVEAHNEKVRAGRLSKLSVNGADSLASAGARAIEAARVFTPETKPVDKPKRKGQLLSVSLFMPIKVISEANSREHWAKKNRRGSSQKQDFEIEWYRLTRGLKIEFPCTVTLVRVGVRKLDSDNLANGFKAIRDCIAALLGVDDGREDLIRWEYDQQAGSKGYGIKVLIKRDL